VSLDLAKSPSGGGVGGGWCISCVGAAGKPRLNGDSVAQLVSIPSDTFFCARANMFFPRTQPNRKSNL
jgi:hypothetical protein